MATAETTYDVIVLGSTLAGLAATVGAARRGQKVLLIEAGTIAGYDFVETLAAVGGWRLPAGAGELAQELHAAAAARKIIVDDRCDLAAFSCLLQDTLARSLKPGAAAALYMTDVTAVQLPTAHQTKFTVTISNRSGIATVRAERLIDATPDAVALRAADLATEQPAAGWAFRGLLVGVDQSTDQAVAASVTAPNTGADDLNACAGRYGTDVVLELRGAGAAPEVGAARVAFTHRVAQLRTQDAWKPFTLSALANLVAATPKITVDAAALERAEAAGFSAVAAWRPEQATLATAPWQAVQAGWAVGAGQLAAAK